MKTILVGMVVVATVLGTSYCGLLEEEEKKPAPKSQINIIEGLPAGWDGTADWEGGRWKVVDL